MDKFESVLSNNPINVNPYKYDCAQSNDSDASIFRYRQRILPNSHHIQQVSDVFHLPIYGLETKIAYFGTQS